MTACAVCGVEVESPCYPHDEDCPVNVDFEFEMPYGCDCPTPPVCPDHCPLCRKDDPVTDDRLFGIPGAEQMQLDLAGAYESQIDPYVDDLDRRPQQIEEWTSVPLGNSLPSADLVIEWAAECASDDLTEDAYCDIDSAAKHPEVLAAFTAALDLWASKTKYRMAEKHVHTWEITWDDEGEPLADGEPIYRKVTGD